MPEIYPGRIELAELLTASGTEGVEILTGRPYTENPGLAYHMEAAIEQARRRILMSAGDSYNLMDWQLFLHTVMPAAGFNMFLCAHDDRRNSDALLAANISLKLILSADSYDNGGYNGLNSANVFGSFNDETPSFEGSTYRGLSFRNSSLGPVGPRCGTQYEFCTHATQGLLHSIDSYVITNPDVADWAQKSTNRTLVQSYIVRNGMDGQIIPEEIQQFTGL